MALAEHRVEGAVSLVTLDRPPVNALSSDLIAAIGAALAEAAAADTRALVITGTPHFAAGADITGFQAAFDAGGRDSLALELSAVVLRLEQLAMVTIAAVRGYALGGGLELAMGADFIYLGQEAKVGQPEIKLGIIPGAGGTQRLPRLVGMGRAKELVYSGRFVGAEEAAEIGLAAKVLPEDDLLPTALADAAEWAKGPTVAYAAARRALHGGWGQPIEEGLAVEAAAFTDCFATDDAREGVAAFLGKREPDFAGR